ncbi:MAG: response regulator, partial [Zetaproteobacteria bacterium]
EQMQRLESLGVLASGIAHDFNNILAAILGHAELAEHMLTSDPAEARACLTTIVTSCEKAAELCRQMLAYAGKGKLAVEPLDLSAQVREIVQVLKASIGKHVEIRLELPDGLPTIEGDAVQIQQVIMNLVLNAAAAIGEEAGVVSIATGVVEADAAYLADSCIENELPSGSYVFLQVSDTGCGMDEATKAKIFEPFFSTKFIGRGMGMSAVLGIVRSHHGTIKIDSQPGQGTTVRVLFPASRQEAQAGKARVSDMSGLTSRTVLVVDDEDTVRKAAAMMLERMGFSVLQAADGEEGLRKYRAYQDRIVGVLLDFAMPKLDGKACLREIKRIDPKAKIALCSGYNEESLGRQWAEEAGVAFIQKPYRMETLKQVVSGWG